MLYSIRQFAKLARICRVMAKHDALFLVQELGVAPIAVFFAKRFSWRKAEGTKGQRLVRAFQELGPTFIKLGQALSVRSDLVGEDIARELAELQDNVPPFHFSQVKDVIEAEFGKSLEDLFSEFDPKPVAAASIAQVHFATTLAGEEVAVKILRPNVEKAFSRDIELFYWIAHSVERAMPKFRRLKPVEVVHNFEETVILEMDLRMEASAAAELQGNMADDPDIKVPLVTWQLTSQQVLTLERVHGVEIDDQNALESAGHDVKEVMRKAATIFFNQVYRDGFFHADMHPGNLFVADDGRIIVIDFGIMGRVKRQTRVHLAQMLLGFLNRDYRKVADVHFDAGYIPSHKSRATFAQACRSIGEPIFELPQNEISLARLLSQLYKVSEEFEMETQPQLLLLQKTMVLAEGLGRTLDPNANFWELARPLVAEWGRKNLGPEARVRAAVDDLRSVGDRVHNLLEAVEVLPTVISKDGIRLHPATIDHFARGRGGRKSGIFKVVAVSAIAASITTLIVVYILSKIM